MTRVKVKGGEKHKTVLIFFFLSKVVQVAYKNFQNVLATNFGNGAVPMEVLQNPKLAFKTVFTK